jgi:integrase
MRHARRLVQFLKGHPLKASRSDLLDFLEHNNAQNAYKAVRVIYGRYLKTDLASDIKIPQSEPQPKIIPPKEVLVETYRRLGKLEHRAAFLMLATSGLRRGELVGLTLEDIDLEKRMIIPGNSTTTKKRWVSFYNEEAERDLQPLLDGLDPQSRIFNYNAGAYSKRFTKVSDGKVSPKVLRDFFAEELGRLGVADRYIDALSGRTAKTVLARHYSDYSPAKLQEIYERAGLRIF